HACGTLVKLLAVLGRPPHVEIAFSVVLAALIVEAVRDLMTDHSPHSAVVDGIVSLEVEEGRLENSGRERDLIVRAGIRSVDGRRRESPTGLVSWLADVLCVAGDLECLRPANVFGV